MHLKAEELVDLAEGTRPESAAPHMAGCEACRAQLTEMRAMMSTVARADVPEPSPLFWNHFSERVHAAVDAEGAPAVGRLGWLLGVRGFQVGIAALASVVLVLFATSRVRAPHAPAESAQVVGQPATPDYLADGAVDADPSLTLVASLTSTLDAEARAETGLARVGSAEHAVTHMNDAELRELHRILQEEMAP